MLLTMEPMMGLAGALSGFGILAGQFAGGR
jgi:hypothetical protein